MSSGYWTCACGIVFLVASAICYAIAMGVGWALAVNVLPGTSLILGAAVVISIPVISVFVYCKYAEKIASSKVLSEAAANCVICIVIISGVFEAVGGALFIIAGVTISDRRVPAYGIAAGVFGILAAFTFVIAQCCCYCGFRESRKEADQAASNQAVLSDINWKA